MFMHNAIGAELLQGKWGKSCIHNVHAFMILLGFDDAIVFLIFSGDGHDLFALFLTWFNASALDAMTWY